MKKIIALAALAVSFLTLTGCNTVRGFGEDVSKVGDKMQDASKK
ncbi:entericidin [Herbaspirillum hiltneri N3]|uniref:Entericidin n=1 Tax=Herbaspirillum hiltneri N3 TaxID=1262470 RepID=A0ABM5UZX7_9BURK|nr:entericidin A/B family lipoprotein [Herbaspirillum hiltneri]AKZ62732.1 entericidin [Herbaspirillum hiltneri N3]